MRRTTAPHVPFRRCVVCRASKPQADMFRLTRVGDVVRLDLKRRLGGRGIWVCHDCAAISDEKRLRPAFRGQAKEVAPLLAEALAAAPRLGSAADAASSSAAMNMNHGGIDVR